MKKFGLIGGVGPESTIAYYGLIIKRFQEVTNSNSYPDQVRLILIAIRYFLNVMKSV